jgi:hypothetical protein
MAVMNRIVLGAVALVMGLGSSLAYAETAVPTGREPDEQMITPADLSALTDARLGVIKAALQMTPDQAKYWPAIEEAVRARAAGRLQRLKALAALTDKGGADTDPVTLMQERASNLIQRGSELKKVADAWEPLYKTLTDEQKQRMRLFAAHFLNMVINAGHVRRMQIEEEVEEQ